MTWLKISEVWNNQILLTLIPANLMLLLWICPLSWATMAVLRKYGATSQKYFIVLWKEKKSQKVTGKVKKVTKKASHTFFWVAFNPKRDLSSKSKSWNTGLHFAPNKVENIFYIRTLCTLRKTLLQSLIIFPIPVEWGPRSS